MLRTGVDIEEDARSLTDIRAIEQRRLQGIEYGFLNTMLSACTTNSHNSPTAILHGGLHIGKVSLNLSI